MLLPCQSPVSGPPAHALTRHLNPAKRSLVRPVPPLVAMTEAVREDMRMLNNTSA